MADYKEGGQADPEQTSGNFEALERDFQSTLDGLVGESSLEQFREEYVKLYDALRKSHDNEKRLVKKINDLTKSNMQSAAQLASVLQHNQADTETVATLQQRVEQAYSLVEAAQKQEEAAKETIEKLQGENDSLTSLVARYSSLLGEDTTLEDVLGERDQLRSRLDEAQAGVRYERERSDDLMGKLEQRRQKFGKQKELITELRAQLRAKEEEETREGKRQQRLRHDLEQVREDLGKKEREVQELHKAYEDADRMNTQMQAKFEEEVSAAGELQSQVEALTSKVKIAMQSAREAAERADRIEGERVQAEDAARIAQRSAAKLEGEKRRLVSEVSGLQGRLESVQKRLADTKLAERSLKTDLKSHEQEADVRSRQLNVAKGAINRLELERRQGDDKLRAEQARKKDAEQRIKEEEQHVRKQEQQLREFTRNAEMMRTSLVSLERYNQQLQATVRTKDKQREEVEAQVRLRDAQIAEAEKREAEAEARVKQQRQMYEQVRADRNLFSKHLIEAQDEIAELKRKLKIMSRQVDQLKEDVAAKDRSLVAVHFDSKAIAKRLDDKTREAEDLRVALTKTDAHVVQLSTVVDELNVAIRKLNEELAEQKRKAAQLVTERDILGTQLIRRNDELALLYEKIDIQESTLQKGAAQYQERIEDVRVLRLKINDLRRALRIARGRAGRLPDLQREVLRLQQEVMGERTKVKALSEELENPMNVHRWRKLEGSDPATYELIQKVQALQKRLIAKTQEAVEKEVIIQDKERVNADLRAMLARQPGPEIAERLAAHQQAVRDKTRRLRSLASELNMSRAQVNEYRFEAERLSQQLQEAKQKFYHEKKKQEKRTAKVAAAAAAAAASGDLAAMAATGDPQAAFAALQRQMQARAAQTATARFAGGGFNTQA